LHAGLLALPLFFCPLFAVDWSNHLWFANYIARHLAENGVLPMFANITSGIGNPILVFYGSALYATLSPLVLLFGPDLGMRIAVAAAFLMPNLALAHIARRCLDSQWTAGCVTIVLSTSLYQLTNIYSRSAATEFFAYQFLLFAFVLLMDALVNGEGRLNPARVILGLVAGAIGVLSHPPTAYLAILFLSMPVVAFAVLQRSAIVAFVRRAVVLVLLCILMVPLAAWAGLTLSFSSALAISGDSQLWFLPQSVDHWLARLLPWPMDFRVEIEGYNAVSTPFLSAPINLAAFALLVMLVTQSDWIDRRSILNRRTAFVLIAAVFATAAVALLASLPGGSLEYTTDGLASPELHSWRTLVLGRIQFAYRLVNLANLILIFGTLAVLVLSKKGQASVRTDFFRHDRNRVALIVVTTISVMSACIKVSEVLREYWLLPKYTRTVPEPVKAGVADWLSPKIVQELRTAVTDTTRAPMTAYGINAYLMPSLLSDYRDDGRRLVKDTLFRPHLARRGVAATACERPCALVTNLVASPFFTLSLDETAVPLTSLRDHDGYVVVLADAGSHRLEVDLGTWATDLFAYSTLLLAVLFWGTLVVVAVRTLVGLSRRDNRAIA
jgi:hypothetical protein